MRLVKACGHCLGDMFTEEYLGDRDLVCLQCGNRKPLPPIALGVRQRNGWPRNQDSSGSDTIQQLEEVNHA